MDDDRQALAEAVKGDLDGVDAALVRLDDGRYGRCDACSERVDDARLAADPLAVLCARCAAAVAERGVQLPLPVDEVDSSEA